MTNYCQRCDDNFFDVDDIHWYKDLALCGDCEQWMEENDGVTGKVIIKKCGECGKVRRWDFQKYKKRGPKPGSKQTKKLPVGTISLMEFNKLKKEQMEATP